ncbi:hypothetical protein INT45_009979 [Circinella minor]|uniref:Reverse transcriptase zinc-binding domain-containing protein n=1 Tax=Circinella minor TaxID=1195481 RepID=A0A8H7S7M1_9FUNG|nr:hypothetical protein INT45_009979 [Circinella minor]
MGAPVHKFHSKLRSIIIKFISHQMFPKVSYQTLCLSRAQDGVGLLDPITQQNALQLRWIIPMLDEPTMFSEHTLCLIHHMATTSKFAPDHRLLLLDYNARKQHVLPTASPVSIIYRTMDHLSLTYPFTFSITIATALQLPATSIFDIHPDHHPKSRPGYFKLQVKDLFTFDPHLQHLRLLNITNQPPHPILLKHFIKYVTDFRIFIRPFFAPLTHPKDHPGGGHRGAIMNIDYSPFSNFLLTHSALSSYKPKTYHTFIQQQHKTSSNISSSRWNNFWSIKMEHGARNILFRLFHSTIPTGNLLHRISPSFLTTPHCRICQHPTETLHHFLIWYPKKKQAWFHTWQELFHIRPPLYAILQSITKNAKVRQHIPSNTFFSICSYILLYIWRAHWAMVFDENPFLPQHVATQAINAIHIHIQL